MAKSGSFKQSASAIISKTAEKLTGIRLSDIEFVHPSKLKENDLNRKFFLEESDGYFEELRNDILKRGIIVPLIAKEDGTLLAGHNRLRVAMELGKESVPVQYVVDNLSSDNERDFLVKDNLLRRQLSNEQRINLYKVLFPDFEATYLNPEANETRGRKSSTDNITLEQIAGETGQTVGAIKSQIKRARDKITGKSPVPKKNSFGETISKVEGEIHRPNGTQKNSFNETISPPVSEISQTQRNSFNETISDLRNVLSSLRHIEEFYVSSAPETRKAIEDSLIQFMSKLSMITEHER